MTNYISSWMHIQTLVQELQISSTSLKLIKVEKLFHVRLIFVLLASKTMSLSNKSPIERQWNAVEEMGDKEEDEKYSDVDEGK